MHFLGAQPVALLSAVYLAQADILVSPRSKGSNTPMKLYSYLASGKPILATNLWTHTQVLTAASAVLTEPRPRASPMVCCTSPPMPPYAANSARQANN